MKEQQRPLIYMDNGATSFPKAPGLGQVMSDVIEKQGANLNRGSHANVVEAGQIALETRELLGKLFNFHDSSHVVFTPSVTYSLNFIIKGLLKPGDHCVVSSLEHHAVMRPLNQLSHHGVAFDRVPCDREGHLKLDEFAKLLRSNTKLVVMLQASNVCGTLLPIREIGQICQEKGIYFVLDTAQTAGHLDIDFYEMGLSALCFTGHKGLLGPAGIGGMLLNPFLAQAMEPLISGGTGSYSEFEEPPNFMPDRFEAGTLNIPGIYGLNHALKYILDMTPARLHQLEMERAKQFIEGISGLDGVRLVGPKDIDQRVAVISLDFVKRDNAEVTFRLAEEYGIQTRYGLHCAPSAHRTLGTFERGTIRFTFSHFTTEEEVNTAIKAVKALM